ncbi:hypothetical protein DPEC_G00351690 [Dallia pectoralis]|uniref:Uncharacterized protein n=1 Tax=Dallia pectoralis TaxID=75939 RepID=A0ACC2F1W4_DALPE|nr:hypothetical protein DPEC_G00351690 [Dallia pectoralis]
MFLLSVGGCSFSWNHIEILTGKFTVRRDSYRPRSHDSILSCRALLPWVMMKMLAQANHSGAISKGTSRHGDNVITSQAIDTC